MIMSSGLLDSPLVPGHFARLLRTSPAVELWKFYLTYIWYAALTRLISFLLSIPPCETLFAIVYLESEFMFLLLDL